MFPVLLFVTTNTLFHISRKVYLSGLPVMVHAGLSILRGVNGIPAEESRKVTLYITTTIKTQNAKNNETA